MMSAPLVELAFVKRHRRMIVCPGLNVQPKLSVENLTFSNEMMMMMIVSCFENLVSYCKI